MNYFAPQFLTPLQLLCQPDVVVTEQLRQSPQTETPNALYEGIMIQLFVGLNLIQ